MSPDSGNIRVFVRWDDDSTVFAGEELKCTIAFKNVAQAAAATAAPGPTAASHSQLKPPSHNHRAANPHASSRLAPPPSSSSSAPRRGHRPSSSLGLTSSKPSRGRTGSIPWAPTSHLPEPQPSNGHSHRRSVSIVSIGSVGSVDSQATSNAGSTVSRPSRGHGRSSSLQIVPRSPGVSGPKSASYPQRPFNSPSSPLYNASYPPDRGSPFHRPSGVSTAPNTPSIDTITSHSVTSPRTPSAALSDFKFPMAPSPLSDMTGVSSKTAVESASRGPPIPLGEPANIPMRPKDPIPTINEQPSNPVARILSTTSVAGTPRSSGEFYSMSNNSTETLASEYVIHQPLRTHGRAPHLRQRSNFSPQKAKRPEALMMGYAQVQGSFTLDGSLVSLAPFEEVKRKAVVGGQGGGVIGLETAKRESGFMRGFGWGSFTNSLGELLGAGELSSIKEMRGIASSKSVPLLSTPQSILFVDLTLAPGESKAFEYSFRLPKGLPPTHRGKAMKITYSLVIGTQRPGGAKEQQVKSVEIPFRILGSVNSHGEILGHDLSSPYIMLRDQAKIRTVDRRGSLYINRRSSEAEARDKAGKGMDPGSSLNGFMSYVDELVNNPRNGPGGGLLSPTAVSESRRFSVLEEVTTSKDAIDFAIIRSNLTAEGQSSANRFEIARNGRRVGVVMLARPAYRLGEVVTMAVDFTGADIPCYAVHAALETSERVDPSLAMRSEASIHRASRKVHVFSSEATLYSRRMVFNPTIPVTATPEFVTSGISLEWKIRLEFVVPSQEPETRTIEEQPEEEEEQENEQQGQERRLIPEPKHQQGPHPLLEEISRDDRGGLVLVAAENLTCESFEVAVPLRVYGAVCKGLERLERDEALEEGLRV